MNEEPLPAFEDSRRLPGPNRWFAGSAVVLTALGADARGAAAHAAWAQRVRRLCAALRWPDPQPLTHGNTLAFAAPDDRLFTATEVNEWAWERCVAVRGPLAEQGWARTQPESDDIAALAPAFDARAAREVSRPLARLKAAAAQHGLPCLEDDDALSIGAGSGSRSWPRAALPLPMDVPWARLHDVPTVLVTGSNGKTTTTRLLAAMATAAGRTVGSCSTEGVVVGGHPVLLGDYAGPAGARAVLRHAAVQFAVLETARGGLLRRGLALRRAAAAVVTNVSADHLGEYGIESLEDIAHTKLVVAHALVPRGTLVLNAGDAVLMRTAAFAPHVQALRSAGRVALFAQEHAHPLLAAHRAMGGRTCGVQEGRLILAHRNDDLQDLGPITALPLTLGGAAAFNVGNLGAAVLAAVAAGLPVAAIRKTLASFGAHPEDNPGRLERWAWHGATVLVDYAHNPDGLEQLLRVARALQPARLGLLLGQAGNRSDEAIAELARTAAAFAPDRVLVKELPAMLRGRIPGQVTALLRQALADAGLAGGRIAFEADEAAAAHALLAWAGPGDVVVLPVHTQATRLALARTLQGPSTSG